MLPEWAAAGSEHWDRIDEARDDEVWRAKEQGREQLVAFIRRRLRESTLARGMSPSDVVWCDEVLDSKALTICFARRFASYKRATLLLSQPDRLRAMLLAGDRPVQFVFAGKAHPADETGKEMIRQIVDVRRRPRHPSSVRVPRGLRHRRRPGAVPGRRRLAEQPAPAAGGVRDVRHEGGVERRAQLLDPRRLVGRAVQRRERLGRVVGRADRRPRAPRRGRGELAVRAARAPDRAAVLRAVGRAGPPPVGAPDQELVAVARARRSPRPAWCATTSRSCTSRPRPRPTGCRATGSARAQELAAWKARVVAAWDGVEVLSVETDIDVASLGRRPRRRSRGLTRQRSTRSDVEVQLLHGLVGQADELEQPTVVTMAAGWAKAGSNRRYRGRFACEQAGRYGFTVRIVPAHPLLTSPVELGRIAWA